MITLCKTCGTAYDEQPKNCPICDDDRQYVPVTGRMDGLRQPYDHAHQQMATAGAAAVQHQNRSRFCHQPARASAAYATGQCSVGLHRQS